MCVYVRVCNCHTHTLTHTHYKHRLRTQTYKNTLCVSNNMMSEVLNSWESVCVEGLCVWIMHGCVFWDVMVSSQITDMNDPPSSNVFIISITHTHIKDWYTTTNTGFPTMSAEEKFGNCIFFSVKGLGKISLAWLSRSHDRVQLHFYTSLKSFFIWLYNRLMKHLVSRKYVCPSIVFFLL